MHLGVIHTIRDRTTWDSVVTGDRAVFPPDFVLLAALTQNDVSRVICFWDAPSLDSLQRMLDELFGAAAVNDCFVADPGRSINLPAPRATTALPDVLTDEKQRLPEPLSGGTRRMVTTRTPRAEAV
jgi:hypothetical protein